MNKYFYFKSLSFLFALIIAFCAPIAVVAQSYAMDYENIQEEFISDDTATTSSDTANYTYTAPLAGDFVVKNVSGEFSLVNNVPTVRFQGLMLTIPAFDYYKIVDSNGNLRFYQADVLNEPSYTLGFAYISIYVEYENLYSMHVQYLCEAEGKLYNIHIILSAQQFQYFDEGATTFVLGSDDISQRLKISARFYTHGIVESNNTIDTAVIGNNTFDPMVINPIEDHSYDEYTDSDGIIRSYVDEYFWEYTTGDGYTIIDDPIVSIVPKELCFIPGEHIYIGREYGFFIRVVTDSLNAAAYAADIMVFDITHTTPSLPTAPTGRARIEPLFQFKYRAIYADDFVESVYTIAPYLSSVVIPHPHYDSAEYFLKDIGFKFSVDNANALNTGDPGYDPYEDDGAFITQVSANALGVGIKTKEESILKDVALFGLGYIPIIGDGLSDFVFILETLLNALDGDYSHQRQVYLEDTQVCIDDFPTNNTDQIQVFGHLLKTVDVLLYSNIEHLRLINVGGNAHAEYRLARSSNSSNNRFRVVTSISVCIVADNSYRDFWGNEHISIDSYGRATGTHETGNYERLADRTVNGCINVTIPADVNKQIIKFTPDVSGLYKIFTISSNGDPDFHITNATKKTDIIPATDNIGREDDLNASLTLSLIAGNVYYINAYSYNSAYGYTLSIGYSPIINQQLTINSPYCVNTEDDSFVMLKFTPTISGYYAISTSRSLGDPQIFLFTNKGVLLDSSDDFDDGLDAFLMSYLVAGTTYYLAVQGYKGSAATFDVLVES